ncbi:2'-5' RNA ligase family protein [Dactylosporangium aurantiacum]
MQNHWDRPGWTPGRRAYYWYLTWDSPDLRDLAEQCQSQLELPYLDPVPLDALHLTMPKLAWEDEISPAEVQAVIRRATQHCASSKSFTLKAGPLAGSPGAVRFSVTPWDPVLDLYQRLRLANLADRTDDSVPFRPHIGVAYCNSRQTPDLLIPKVQALRELPTVELYTASVDLVLLRREGRTYRWSTCATVPLLV